MSQLRSGSSQCLWTSTLFIALLSMPMTHGANYGEALTKSLLYFEAQRSGKLPPNQRVNWRGDSALRDGSDAHVDLTGGYYDAGDNMKFGFSMAFTTTMLAWSSVEMESELKTYKEHDNVLAAIKWATDYLINAHPEPNVLYGQVGDGNSDHACWMRPEDMTTPRPSYRIDAQHPGADLAGETAAAMAAASLAFAQYDAAYSAKLIGHAKDLFEFAKAYPGLYQSSITNAGGFYPSSGYQDELFWAAAWLHRATDDQTYLDYLMEEYGTGGQRTIFAWDDKFVGAQVLMAKLALERGGNTGDKLQDFKNMAEYFICNCVQMGSNNVKVTPGGLLWFLPWNNLQYTTTASFVLAAYSKYLKAGNKGGKDLFKNDAVMDKQPASSWSIHTRPEIIAKYEIFERVGSGAYADVYRARRISDGLTVALKEIFDYQSAFREIDALSILHGSPNVVLMHEYFWREDENAVIVLEFLRSDLAAVIRDAKRRKKKGEGGGDGFSVGEIKRWMVQILNGVDACHRNMIVHRDLKPGNMLIGDDGVLKLADFGQARILMESDNLATDENQQEEREGEASREPPEVIPDYVNSSQKGSEGQEQEVLSRDEYFRQVEELKAKQVLRDDTDKDSNVPDGDGASCLATCTVSEMDDDFGTNSFTYDEGLDGGGEGLMTSCVGTRWFRPPELLYGSTMYGLEIDLWSLGCVFAELLSLEPLFPGVSDIDQISRVTNVLGNLNEEVWPGCVDLPDYKSISFAEVESPLGVEGCLPNHSGEVIALLKKLICYDPARRATAVEMLSDKYFKEEPLPVPVSELYVPPAMSGPDEEDSPRKWNDYREMDSDSDGFGPVNVKPTSSGFTIEFP